MQKSNKAEALRRIEVLEIFQKLFSLIGINVDVSKEFKTSEPYMKDLTRKILSQEGIVSPYGTEEKPKSFEQAVDDYSEYLRKRLNDARKPEKETVSFMPRFIQPLRDFPLIFSTTLLESVVYTPKKYQGFNFWRMPVYGRLSRRNGKLYFDASSGGLEIELVQDCKNSAIKMPRDRSKNWLKVRNRENQQVYLAEFDMEDHKLISPDNLMSYLV